MPRSVVPLVDETTVGRLRRAAVGTVVQAGTRPLLHHRLPLPFRRRAMSTVGRIATPRPRSSRIDRVDLGGVPTWRATPPDARADADLFVLHGGGYWYGGLGTHAAYAHLAQACGMTMWMPDYRLVPDHAADAPLQDAIASWEALVAARPHARRFVTGDSAGAGLAISLACALRDGDAATEPDGLLLHSPWVDASTAVLERRRPDRILHTSLMARDRDRWVGGRDERDPAVSPLRNDLRGLPRTTVQWGEHEALHEDAEELVDALDAAGVEAVGEAHPHLWHDAFLHVPALPDAVAWLARSADQLVAWLDD